MPFAWTINPYRGCEFACTYCYARYTHGFLEFPDPYDFENLIFAKRWNPVLFREQLRRIDPGQGIAIGTATDPYQPAERRFLRTREVLEVLATLEGYRLSIATKSDLIVRDAPVLAKLARRHRLSVNFTVTTLDPALARILEPRAPRPDLRLGALARLTQAGVDCGVLCCPLLPRINDRQAQLDALAEAAARAGARWLGANPVFLPDAAKAVFFEFLERAFPDLVASYRQHFSHGRFLKNAYPAWIARRVDVIRGRHGLDGHGPDWTAPVFSRQLTFDFQNDDGTLCLTPDPAAL
jgi:DNA repair photolyase